MFSKVLGWIFVFGALLWLWLALEAARGNLWAISGFIACVVTSVHLAICAYLELSGRRGE